MLSAMLLSNHNLYFLINMMGNIRKAIEEDRFPEYKKEFYDKVYENPSAKGYSQRLFSRLFYPAD